MAASRSPLNYTGKKDGMIFKHGQPVVRVPVVELADTLIQLIERENS